MKANKWMYKINNDTTSLHHTVLSWSACHDNKHETPPPKRNRGQKTTKNKLSHSPPTQSIQPEDLKNGSEDLSKDAD